MSTACVSPAEPRGYQLPHGTGTQRHRQRLVDEALFLNRASAQHPPTECRHPPFRLPSPSLPALLAPCRPHFQLQPVPAMAKTGIGHPHIDARSLAMTKIIVERIDADPTLIELAHRYLENEERRHGRLCQASKEWRAILARPWSEIRAILLEESDEGQRLRSSKPFAGIVTEEERVAIIERFPPPWPSIPYKPATVPEEVMKRILEDGPKR